MVSALLFAVVVAPQWFVAVRSLRDVIDPESEGLLEVKGQDGTSSQGSSCSKVESVQWLNDLLGKDGLWPHIDKMVNTLVTGQITTDMQRGIPAWTHMQDLHFETLSLGDHSPTLHDLKMCRQGASMSLKFDLDFKSSLEIKLRAGSIKLGLKELSLSGTMIVNLGEFIDESPLLGGVTVYFADAPDIDWKLAGLHGLAKVAELGSVKNTIRDVIKGVISDILVAPNSIVVPIGTELQGVNMARLKHPPPVGILTVSPIAAANLPNTDFQFAGHKFGGKHARADAYFRLTLADEEWESSVKDNMVNPVWCEAEEAKQNKCKESVPFVVWSPYQKLRADVYDHDKMSGDEIIGSVVGTVTEIAKLSNQHMELECKKYPDVAATIQLGFEMRCLDSPTALPGSPVLRIGIQKVTARDEEGKPVGKPVIVEASFGSEQEKGMLFWKKIKWEFIDVKATKAYTGIERHDIIDSHSMTTMIKMAKKGISESDIAEMTCEEPCKDKAKWQDVVKRVLRQEAQALANEARGIVDVDDTLWLPLVGSSQAGGSLRLVCKTEDGKTVGQPISIPYEEIPVANSLAKVSPFMHMGGKEFEIQVSITSLTTGPCKPF